MAYRPTRNGQTRDKSDAILLRVYNHLSQEEALDDLNKANQRIAERRARELSQGTIPQNAPQKFEGSPTNELK
jgi:hypothetical protein